MILKLRNNKVKIVLLVVLVFMGVLTSLPLIKSSDGDSQPLEEPSPKTAQSQTAIILPDGDIQTPWMTSTPHWNKLDECESESNPDGNTVIANSADTGEIEIFRIDNSIKSVKSVSQITVHTNGMSAGTTNPKVSIWWNGAWTAWQTVNVPLSPSPYPPIPGQWTENEFNVVGLQSDVNNLQVRYQAYCNLWIYNPYLGTYMNLGSNTLNAFFCEVTYESGEELSDICRPSNDGDENGWSPVGIDHWDLLNEYVINPQPGGGGSITAAEPEHGTIEEFEMSNNIQFVEKVKKIEIHTYGKSTGNTNPKVRIWWNGAWSNWKTVGLPRSFLPGPPGPGWAINEWEIKEGEEFEQGDQFDVNELKIQYQAQCTGWISGPGPGGIIPIGSNTILTSYCNVTYEEVDDYIPIGGLNRRFPKGTTPTKLGYTFYTVSTLDPKVQFKVTEVGNDGDVTINLYLDKGTINPDPNPDPFWSKSLNIGGSYESERINVNDLTNYRTHSLIIEIENSGNSEYTLDYLEIHNSVFKNYNYDDVRDYYYSPTTFKEEDEIKDYLTVSTNTLLTDLLNPEGLIDKDDAQNPHFSTSLFAAIDDDIEATNPYLRYYFIQSVKYEIRILDPNGDYIDNNRIWIEEDEMQTSAEVDPDPAYENDDLIFLFQTLVHMIIDYVPYIDINYLYDLLIYLGGEDTITDSTFVNGWQDDHLYIKWEDGIINYGDINIWNFDYDCGVKPRNGLNEISLWSHWQCNPRTTYGKHQVEISWEIEVNEYQKVMFITFPFIVCWSHEIYEGFTMTGSQYFNFEFIE